MQPTGQALFRTVRVRVRVKGSAFPLFLLFFLLGYGEEGVIRFSRLWSSPVLRAYFSFQMHQGLPFLVLVLVLVLVSVVVLVLLVVLLVLVEVP
jgi:hypothetical protein